MVAPEAARARILTGSGGRWRLDAAPDLAGFADAGAGLPSLMRLLLARRGVTTTEAARRFLGSPRDLTDPQLMPNLDVAVDRLARACRAGETVAVYGDYDVDGVTATAVLTEGLRALGAKPMPYLPDRFTEGYGPNVRAIRRLADQGATLLVTADTGTSAVTEVAEANGLGMDVVVIDHHTIPDVLPDALAIVNPKLNGNSYGSEPAAVGVAYKVVHDLYDRLGQHYDPAPHRALVALGTVCDLAPLLGECRDLLRIGIEALRTTTRPGLLALCEVAGIEPRLIDAEGIGWVIGPRINAAGRMAHARIALDLLLAPTIEEARTIAAEIERLNDNRRTATTQAVELARSLAGDPAPPLIVVDSSEMSSGIIGLAAARLAEEFHRPAIAIGIEGGEGRGSCRSIPAFDVTALLQRNSDLFLRYGGHRAAAGFSIAPERIPEMRARLTEDTARHLDPDAMISALEIDAELPLTEVDRRMVQWLGLLGPFGNGNPAPVFLARGVRVANNRTVGADGAHLQMALRAGNVTWRAIAFRQATSAVAAGEDADVVYTFRSDQFGGEARLQLEVLDLRPTSDEGFGTA
ncbi:MAG: single-stranded-DNA-specific exonuclease RecJ [Chloroflexi bacterium]|nr:MAG: single-stranded-DNA-specific exonuclease RecJ [Chloroflexota bacterium]